MLNLLGKMVGVVRIELTTPSMSPKPPRLKTALLKGFRTLRHPEHQRTNAERFQNPLQLYCNCPSPAGGRDHG